MELSNKESLSFRALNNFVGTLVMKFVVSCIATCLQLIQSSSHQTHFFFVLVSDL